MAIINPLKKLYAWQLWNTPVDDLGSGIQGPTGPQGATGPTGATGPAGPQGIQGVAGAVGPAGLNWQGTWSAAGTYVADDAVGYSGASYFCINPVGPSATTPDVDTANWALLASQGAVGAQGPTGATGPTGPQGPQGIQGVQGPAGSGFGYSNYVEIPISAAQLLTVGTPGVEITLLPSLALNQYYDFKYILEFKAGTSPYGIAGGNFYVGIGGSGGEPAGPALAASSFAAGTVGDVRIWGPRLSVPPSNPYLDIASIGAASPVTFFGVGTPMTGGNGTIVFKIWYNIITMS